MATLNQTISTIHTVSSLLTNFAQEGDLCFADKLQLAMLCDELRDTNAIIEYAEQEAKADIQQLENDAKTMKEEAESVSHTIADNKQVFASVDCKAECDAHLKPFESVYNDAMQRATALWQEYTSMSNRLDMTDMHSEVYKTLDADCDAKKAEYDKAHAETESVHAKYDAERRRIAKLYYFDINVTELLIVKIRQIAEAIIKDITESRKPRNKPMPTTNNPNTLLLQETAKLFDLVDIVLCAYLYKVCNNVLFEDMLGTDFVNFLNNRPTTTPVVVRPK